MCGDWGPPSPEQLAFYISGWVVFTHQVVFPGTGKAAYFMAVSWGASVGSIYAAGGKRYTFFV